MKSHVGLLEIAFLAIIATGLSIMTAVPAQAQATGAPPAATQAASEDTVLYNFKDAAGAADWTPAKLPEVKADQPAPKVEIVADKNAGGPGLKLTFDGGDWPIVATTKIPVEGNWKQFQTLKAVLTVDGPIVAYFRILQGKPDEKGKQPLFERTMILQKGANEVTLLLHGYYQSMDTKNGDVTSFIIGALAPDKGQTLLVNSINLSKDWPKPRTMGWYSLYNQDGFSSACAAEFKRTGTLVRFKVLGNDPNAPADVADCADLAKQLKDKWTKPEAKTIEQVEADFKAKFEALKKDHPKAVMAILRDGEKGFDPAAPDKAYAGWKFCYISCHGPDGPNPNREKSAAKYDTVEVFMRHRSPILQADLTSIPKGAAVLAARLVVTRAVKDDFKAPDKPTMFVAEPCNREWDDTAANCYSYAKGKLWKAVSGLYYGEDPDYWPVLLMHGPSGGGAVTDWDFTEGLKFWTDGKHENHGFFLYGDSSDLMSMYTPKAKEPNRRPAIMVVYEPK